ncbi:hypothetical protein ABFG95_06930 [Achromobacter sp. HNDS-1]|uniref:Uncharacterized protein n=1 Tax=Achromobacter sp. HNDS-1 TaxID=3151598 RepID=A0AAU7LE68_9BURK
MKNELETKPLKMSLEQVLKAFNAAIEEAEIFLSPARSSRLQFEHCLSLDSLLHQATHLKHQAIDRCNDHDANAFLGLECAIGAVRAELIMWILLKRDMPNEAWNRLIAAQMACLDASRAHVIFGHCIQGFERLVELERSLFPPQVFVSAGFISDKLDCSICGARYSTCKHLRGKPYMGQFCEVVHSDIRADHVAVVKTPADKRCRVVSFKVKEGHRDRLSWEISPYKNGEVFKDDDALQAQSILLSTDRYPYLASTSEVLSPT